MNDQKQTSLAISRRGFVQGAIGTLITLPAVNGVGIFSMQRVAHAVGIPDQPGKAYTNEEYAKITVVTREEVCIVVNDVAKGEKAFVPGAKVKLTSRFAKITERYDVDTLEGITDEEGKVFFNIKGIAENVDYLPLDEIDPYEFNGSIEVTCDGYRTFKTGLLRVRGRDVIVAPTRSFEPGDPMAYPHMVSFNEWDVLYCADNQFCLTEGNDRDQTLEVEGRNFGSEDCIVTLREQGAATDLMSTKATPKNGALKASFTHKFSLLGGEKSLEEGKSYEIEVVQGALTYVWPLQLKVGQSVLAKNVNGNFDLNPFETKMATAWGLNFTWPESIPVFGGSQCSIGNIFKFPINVNVDPFGFAQIAISLPIAGYKNDNGEESTVRWNQDPVVMPQAQWDKYIDGLKKSWNEAVPKMKEKGAFKKSELFSQFEMGLYLQFLAAFQFMGAFGLRDEEHIFRGMGGAQVNFSVSYVVTQQFFVGYIPLLASFNFDASAIFAAKFQMHTEPVDPGRDLINQIMSPSCWTIEPSGVNLSFTLTLAPAVSVGVGIRGIASLSVKFKCSFVISIMLPVSALWEDDAFKGKGLPHATGQCQFFLQVVVQFFFFSNTWNIPPRFPLWTIFDNWKGISEPEDEMSTQAAMSTQAEGGMPSLAEFMGGMKLITSGMLRKSIEATGKLAAPTDLTTQSLDDRPVDDALDDEGVFDWGKVFEGNIEHSLADGSAVTYAVYHFPGPDEAFGEASHGAQQMQTQDMRAEDERSSTSAKSLTFARIPASVPGSSRWHRGNTVRFEDCRVTGFGTSQDGLTTQADDGEFLPQPGVKEVRNTGGIRPTSDVIISTDKNGNKSYVYGDPHIKVVDIQTNVSSAQIDYRATCSFRIGVVEVDGLVRSRLIMTVLDAGDALKSFVGMQRVIDFNITGVEGISHADLFDYEYSLAFSEYTKKTSGIEVREDMVEIVLVSGRRAADDNTVITAAATDLYFTYLSFNAQDLLKDDYGVSQAYFQLTVPANQILDPKGAGDNLVHNISCINSISISDGEKAKLLVAYLDRSASSADAVFSDAAQVRPRFLFIHNDRGGTDVVIPDNSELIDKRMVINGNVFNDPTITRMTLSPEIQKSHTLSLQGQSVTYFFLLSFELDAETSREGFKSVVWCPMPESALSLVPWPQQDCFLTSFASPEYRKTDEYKEGLADHSKWDRSKWLLQKAWWKFEPDSVGVNVLEFEPIGPDCFNFSRFALNSAGTFIFWPEGHDAVDEFVKDVYDQIADVEEGEPLNQIRACRVRNNADGSLHFSDSFVAADLPHGIDSLEVVATHNRYAPFEVLSTELVDTGDTMTDNLGETVPLYHASYLWYTSVPNLQCATVVASSCSLPAVPAGGTALFDVTIRNDGNSFLSGCKLCMFVHDLEVDEKGNALRDADGNYMDHGVTQVGDYFDVAFADTLHESPFDPKDDQGNFINQEPDFALPPGKRSEYRVKVSIPEDWADVKYVSFHAKDPVMAEGGGLAAQSVGNGLTTQADDRGIVFQQYAVEPGTYPVLQNRTTPEQSKSQRFMIRLPVSDTASAISSYADAPVSVYETGTYPDSKDSSVTKSSVPASGSAPKTGDGIPWGLLAGAGAAGAAMAAYSKRRLENEAAAAESENAE